MKGVITLNVLVTAPNPSIFSVMNYRVALDWIAQHRLQVRIFLMQAFTTALLQMGAPCLALTMAGQQYLAEKRKESEFRQMLAWWQSHQQALWN